MLPRCFCVSLAGFPSIETELLFGAAKVLFALLRAARWGMSASNEEQGLDVVLPDGFARNWLYWFLVHEIILPQGRSPRRGYGTHEFAF
jgi:hypothetical protein